MDEHECKYRLDRIKYLASLSTYINSRKRLDTALRQNWERHINDVVRILEV